MNKPIKVKVTILTPVHIGCDDIYEPTNFRIENDKLIHFDTFNFIDSLNDADRKKLVDICSRGDISSLLEIYKFVRDKRVFGREISIVNHLAEHYEQVLRLPTNDVRRIKQELNNFAIARTAYTPNDNLPYIPGSSLKGSIRTAYLNKLVKEKDVRNYNGRAKDLEAELLGGTFNNDPFRFVKISDFIPVSNVKTKIYYAINLKKTGKRARGPYQILETIQQNSIFEGAINIETPTNGNINSITAENLKEAIKNFYSSIIDEELKVFTKLNLNSELIQKLRSLKENSLLIKIGRHSGAEAVTIEGNRKITIRGPRGQNTTGSSSTTVWLASDNKNPNDNSRLLPFGWAKIEFMEMDANVFPEKMKNSEYLSISQNVAKQDKENALEKDQTRFKIEEREEVIITEIRFDPGSKMIILEEKGRKIANKQLTDKSFVPEALHKKLFDKKEKVKAKVTVKKTGNFVEIEKIDMV